MDQFTLAEAAVLIGRSPSTLRHQAQRGTLRARLIGKTWVVTRRDLDRYVRDHRRAEREA
jgi:excisionase family DNA binding protein